MLRKYFLQSQSTNTKLPVHHKRHISLPWYRKFKGSFCTEGIVESQRVGYLYKWSSLSTILQNQVGREIRFQVSFRSGIKQEPDSGFVLNGTKISSTVLTLSEFKCAAAWLVCDHQFIIFIYCFYIYFIFIFILFLYPQTTAYETEFCPRSIPVIGSQPGNPGWEHPIKAFQTERKTTSVSKYCNKNSEFIFELFFSPLNKVQPGSKNPLLTAKMGSKRRHLGLSPITQNFCNSDKVGL